MKEIEKSLLHFSNKKLSTQDIKNIMDSIKVKKAKNISLAEILDIKAKLEGYNPFNKFDELIVNSFGKYNYELMENNPAIFTEENKDELLKILADYYVIAEERENKEKQEDNER